MKILFANNLCGFYGGVEQVVAHTARDLVRRGHACHLAYGRAGTNPEDFAQMFSTAICCSEFAGTAEGRPFHEIVESLRPDVVFFHKVDTLPPGIESLSGPRRVVLVHDHDLWCPTGMGYDRRTRKMCTHPAGWQCHLSLAFLEKKAGGVLPFRLRNIHSRIREMRRYHNFDTILANSKFIREKLIANRFPPEKTRLCHPVLDQPELEPAPVPNEPNILFVGSLIRGKGVDLLLRALGELRCDYRVQIVGTGKSEHELKELAASLGVAGAVTFAGWVPNEKVADYYREARVVAVPSAWPEPFGLVGLEAMRHGRPVAAFRSGGIADWLDHGKTGLMAPPLDVPALSQALERLLTEPGLAEQFGAAGAQRVREKFSFRGYMDTLEKFLQGNGAALEV